jgi:hypothetical protein
MTEALYREYRAALRTPARFAILSLERRGARLWVTDANRLIVQPSRVLTNADRATLRQHADAAKLLIRHRADWCDWHTREAPSFDPTHAFLTNDEIRGQSA